MTNMSDFEGASSDEDFDLLEILETQDGAMLSIAVPTDYTRHHDFSKATKVCASLKEITLELLQALGSRRGEAGIVRGF